MSRVSRFANCVSVEVDIEIDDFFLEISTEQLISELKRRKRDSADTHRAQVKRAIAEIRRGDHQDAITTLEREFFPKWQSSDASEAEYKQVQGGAK